MLEGYKAESKDPLEKENINLNNPTASNMPLNESEKQFLRENILKAIDSCTNKVIM